MKKTNQFVLGFAIALTGALGFSACSSNDEAEVNNPNYNPETNEVLAKFVFNVSTGNTATTRQSSAATTVPLDGRSPAVYGEIQESLIISDNTI